MVMSLTGADRYEVIKELGEGTFGVVSKARDRKTDRIVAVKKVRMGNYKDGVSVTALREIKLLQEIKHKNVIELVDVFATRTNVNVVLEYCVTDLEEVIKDRTIILSPQEVKTCLHMILSGLASCHKHWTLHRDLKPSNILVGADGNLKLADFGLARIFGSPNPRMTHQVITRWYRPPELLYAADKYGPAVDMWSVGCIFAELMLRVPYIAGNSDIDQLSKIFLARGTPKDGEWPGKEQLPAYVKFSDTPAPDHKRLFTAASPAALDLLNTFLALNPTDRISCDDALKHDYFVQEEPKICSANDLMRKIKSGNTIKDTDRIMNYGKAAPVSTASDEHVQSHSNKRFSLGKRRLEF